MSTTTLTKDEQFFYDHAGFSYDPKTETKRAGKIRCAREMATAEAFAAEHDWGFTWEYDIDGCIGCDCGSPECDCAAGNPHEVFCLLLRDFDGNVLASLGSICAPSNDYTRVVEAELAVEAMHNHAATERMMAS